MQIHLKLDLNVCTMHVSAKFLITSLSQTSEFSKELLIKNDLRNMNHGSFLENSMNHLSVRIEW